MNSTSKLWREVQAAPEIDVEYVAAQIIEIIAPAEASREIFGAMTIAFLDETLARPPAPPQGDLLLEARWRDQARQYLENVDTGIPKVGALVQAIVNLFHFPKETGPVFGTVPVTATPQLVENIILEIARQDLVPWDPLESTCRHASLSIL